MDEMVKKFLEEKRNKIEKKKKEEKNKKLIELGLFKSVPNNSASEETGSSSGSHYVWDNEKKMAIPVHSRVAMDVTDEEYEEILKVTKEYDELFASPKKETDNKLTEKKKIIYSSYDSIIKSLYWISKLIICGGIIIGAFTIISSIGEKDFWENFLVAFSIIWQAFVAGMIFWGFSAVLQLLQDIRDK